LRINFFLVVINQSNKPSSLDPTFQPMLAKGSFSQRMGVLTKGPSYNKIIKATLIKMIGIYNY
jgi:hypothetical protein